MSLFNIVKYFSIMSVAFHDYNSLFGFFIFLSIGSQLISGIMLSFSYIPEAMLTVIVRDEEDIEDLYTDDFFWIHERGVDLIFIFSYFHLFRKIYLNLFELEVESSWKSGVFTFLLINAVVFLGLVLCCTHLSEITLTIAANIIHTFFLFCGKPYWWLLTDKQLCTDTIIRLAYAHYIGAFLVFYLGLVHGIDMHYDWKNESVNDNLTIELSWWTEAFMNEFSSSIDCIILVTMACFFFYSDPEALSYEFFMWGDIGLVPDIRFYGVAPHWYFRPFMGWLIVCPYHKTGVFGLVFFFIILYFQPALHGTNEQNGYNLRVSLINANNYKNFTPLYINQELNLCHQFFFGVFIVCLMYTTSFLPYGKYYNRLDGNFWMLFSCFYSLIYLAFPFFRRSQFLYFFNIFISNKFLYFYQN